ncbi:MAG: rod shape-determining protein MreC [Gammaproteobacteria bacterium]|jgi:rod shape-determining protein MreC|nr:rod shape-determining protein MreC [Gammaproteobacteria bacterium]
MKAMFVRQSGAGYLLFGLGMLSALLIAVESSTRLLDPVRGFIANLASPIYFVAQAPYVMEETVSDLLSTRSDLMARNASLERRVLALAQVSQQYIALKAENDRLRALLGSQGRVSYEFLIAELVGIVPDPNTHQIILDKGAEAGLEIGYAVLDSQGLFGQVVEVSRLTSRVLLLTDRDHAVPVRVSRNGVRGIVGGTGDMGSLSVENVSTLSDIVEGDLLETSGLAGRFPAGYPVGTVTSVVGDAAAASVQVRVVPTAQLDRAQHVLVIFPPDKLGRAP